MSSGMVSERATVETAVEGLMSAARVCAAMSFEEVDPELLGGFVVALSQVESMVAAAKLHAARVFDESEQWTSIGAKNAASWIAAKTTSTLHAASTMVGVSRKLVWMPATDEALSRGRLSFRQAQQIAGVLRDDTAARFFEHETELVFQVCRRPADQTHRLMDWWINRLREPGLDRDRQRREDRTLSSTRTVEGMGRISALHHPEDAQIIDHVLQTLVERDWARKAPDDTRTYAQRLADAHLDMARRALSTIAKEDVYRRVDHRVDVVIDYDTLVERAGRSDLGTGAPLTGEAARRLCCDAGISRHIVKGRSLALDRGREVRLADPWQRNALDVRDGGCVFPECLAPPGWCFAHHVDEWWAHEGDTDVERMVLLCRHHHTQVHDGGWTLDRDIDTGEIRIEPPPHLTPTRTPTRPPIAA